MPQQRTGEHDEVVMERSFVEGGWLDEEISDSFPASDPLSTWAGPRRREGDADRGHAPEGEQVEQPRHDTKAR